MSTPLPIKWRHRHWAFCFLASTFPFDNEPKRFFTSSPPSPMPITNVVFDTKSIASKGKENSKKMSRQRRRSSPHAKDVVVEKKTTSDSSWPKFEDEDYIVFCFKEDGAFDVVKNGNNSETSHCIDLVSTSSRPVSRKLNYSEVDKAAKRYNNGVHIGSAQKEEGEGEEIENIYMDKEENTMENHNEVMNDHSNVAVPTESSDSNHSDVSNGSFAFPVLGWEWSGSPVQMPKSKGLQLRKHKVRCVGFQYCCKF